jgi:hypothetical protein
MAYLVERSKNLLKIKGRTQAPYDSDAGGNTSIRNFSEDYYYVGMTSNNKWYYWYVEQYLVEENKVEVKSKNAAYGIAFPIKCKPDTVYALSFVGTSILCAIGFYTENGEWLDLINDTISFTTPENCGWFTICFRSKELSQIATYTDIMLNEGEVALPYEPYGARIFNSKNLLDINKIVCVAGTSTNNGDGSITVTDYNDTTAHALSYYAPRLKVGETYTLSLKTESNNKFIYLYGGKFGAWRSGQSIVMTKEILNEVFNIYGYSIDTENYKQPCRVWDFGIYEGNEALPYEPYKAEPFKKVRVAYYKGKRIFLDRNFFGVSGSSTLASLARFKLSDLSRMKLR